MFPFLQEIEFYENNLVLLEKKKLLRKNPFKEKNIFERKMFMKEKLIFGRKKSGRKIIY